MFVRFNFITKLDSFELIVNGDFKDGITGIFGPSGSGKTVLLKSLAGMLPADSGQIMVNDEIYFSSDKNISMPLENRRIVMVWTDALLFPHLTVEENIRYGCRVDLLASFIADVIDILEIRPFLKHRPSALSGGERHRVALARAILHEPKLLLVDEPSLLDARSRQKIISCLKVINREFKIPVCYVSHSLSELMFLCQEVYVIEEGRRVRFDPPEKVFINEMQLAAMEEDFDNILELPVVNIRLDEKVTELDLGGFMLKVTYHTTKNPKTLKVGIRAKDILLATEKIKGVSARNIISAVIEKVEPTGEMVFLCCRIGDRRLWAEITPGSFRDLNLYVSQIVYVIIKSRLIRVLD